MLVAPEVSAPGKFPLDSVRPNNKNGRLWVNSLIPGFTLVVVGQVLELHPYQASPESAIYLSAEPSVEVFI